MIIGVLGLAITAFVYVEGRLDKADEIYADLYENSKDLLYLLQPSGGNTFSGELVECMNELANRQILPMELVRIVEIPDSDLPTPNITFQLTDLGKAVRATITKVRGTAKPILPCFSLNDNG